jgi:hypothetical protein
MRRTKIREIGSQRSISNSADKEREIGELHNLLEKAFDEVSGLPGPVYVHQKRRSGS